MGYHLRSHHVLLWNEAAPPCVCSSGCTYERRPPPAHDFWAKDRARESNRTLTQADVDRGNAAFGTKGRL